MVRIVVPVDAVPKGRPRVTRRGFAYTPKRTKDFEALVARHAAKKWGVRPPFGGPVRVEIFYQPRTNRRSDVDNVAKAVMDALIGIVYEDDSQVRTLVVVRGQKTVTPTVTIDVEEGAHA